MISVISPVFNEKESVRELHSHLVSVLQKMNQPFEIIFVDDGSTDGSREVLENLTPATTVVFSRNFGKSQALQAGFDMAKGDIIITMDSDLQDDPEEIPHFVSKIEEGYDLVVGWKQKRLDSAPRRFVSKIANNTTGFATGVWIHDMNCGFKAYRSDAAKSLSLHGDLHRYIPALLSAQGFKVTEIVVNHHERKYGKSKYGIGRLFAGAFDFATLLFLRKFSDRPLYFFGSLGIVSSMFGVIFLAYLTWIKIFNGALIGNRPLLLFGVLLVVVGFQFFSLGFMGDLIIRRTSHGQKPQYLIRRHMSQ